MTNKAVVLKTKLDYYTNLAYKMTVEKRTDQGTYYVASYPELFGLVMTGQTPEEAVSELEAVKADWFEAHLEQGHEIPLPGAESRAYSGKISLRIAPSLHARLDAQAQKEKVSLNQLLGTCIAFGLSSLSGVGISPSSPPPIETSKKKTSIRAGV
jgi:predicted HicB family RNase H-like nuclease